MSGGLRELHLFAGAGGGILGGMLLGHTCVCAVELEPYCRRVLLQRQRDGILPRFPIWDDVRTFDGKPWRGRVDVVCGGFPCQDISTAGKGAGIDGEQSGLWSEFARIIGEVRPRFVFVENSPALASRGLGRVLGDLSALGFDAEWGVVSAAAAGFPHQRQRIWILADSERDEQPREESRLGTAGRMGRVVESLAANTDWEGLLSRVRGTGHGLAHRVDRTDAVRNGQVPVVAALAWRTLASPPRRAGEFALAEVEQPVEAAGRGGLGDLAAG
jgi:DNA (cytosine-5)-methyltransferase 1